MGTKILSQNNNCAYDWWCSAFMFFLLFFHPPKETKNQPHTTNSPPQKAVSFFVSKTINSVLKSSRKIIFRVCEAASVKKPFKMFQMYSNMQRRQNSEDPKEPETTGHDRFYQDRSRYFTRLRFRRKFKVSDVNLRRGWADKVLMFSNIKSRRKFSCRQNRTVRFSLGFITDLCWETFSLLPQLTSHVIFPSNHLRCLLHKNT